MDKMTIGLLVGVFIALGGITGAIYLLKRNSEHGIDSAVLDTFQARLRAWWLLFGVLTGAFLVGHTVTVVLFFLISFWALREYITLTPTRPADHGMLFWVLFLCTPLQFFLVGVDSRWFQSLTGIPSYQVYSIMIPVYVFLLLPAGMAMRGDAKRFLERVAKLQAGLLICVYCLSYAPALLTIEFPGPDPLEASETAEVLEHGIEEKVVDALGLESSEEGETHPAKYPRPTLTGRRLRLLFYFILMVQLSDVFQYLWSQIPLKHPIAPKINLSRTWEGIFGGAATTMLCGMALWFVTPFPHWWQAGMIALAISLMGFAGSMTMSAIKRDRGVEDYGTLIEGHSGVLDRMDSVCFAAPVFYHMTWLFLNL